MRDTLKSNMKKHRITKSTKRRKRKPVFFSDEIEKMFYKMSRECQEFIMSGGK